VNSPLFGADGPLPLRDGFDLLAAGRSPRKWLSVVTGVRYFARTCSPPDDDDEPSSDDFRFRATGKMVGGQQVDVEPLLSAYVDRIADRFDPDAEYPFPGTVIAEQHAQLTALANGGLLDANAATDYTVDTTMTAEPTIDETKMSRTERLDDFIERHDALSDGERQGIFALGALVGRISRYQRGEDRSITAVKQHPIDKLSRHNLRQVATDVVDANVVYSDEEGYNGTMYAELMDEVVDGLLDRSPDDWNLDTTDLRYHYAMGIAYGLNDRSTSDYDNE
jgi:CRISPR-associated protein Cas8b/Csh1 subtype I-B